MAAGVVAGQGEVVRRVQAAWSARAMMLSSVR